MGGAGDNRLNGPLRVYFLRYKRKTSRKSKTQKSFFPYLIYKELLAETPFFERFGKKMNF